MTNEEAINGLKKLFNEHELDLQICGVKQDSLLIRDMAIKALEKEIPKKPIIIKINDWEEIIKCGKCFMCASITRAVDYCPHCGTKIDWT